MEHILIQKLEHILIQELLPVLQDSMLELDSYVGTARKCLCGSNWEINFSKAVLQVLEEGRSNDFKQESGWSMLFTFSLLLNQMTHFQVSLWYIGKVLISEIVNNDI